MTRKSNLKLFRAESYLYDIYGSQIKNNETGEVIQQRKGLLDQALPQSTKIHLKRLAKTINQENETFKEQIETLKKEFYEPDPENKERLKLKEEFTIEEVNTKSQELSNVEVEIEHYDFKITDFNFSSTEFYDIIDFLVP